jgi:TetR/AcrR family transcriptional regulator, transcriptional repressor for nem operon
MARPREFDERMVLDAIRNTFWDRGYAATSVDDLVQATGLGKGSLYGAFGSKREMFVRSLREYCEGGLAYAERTMIGEDTGTLRRMRDYVRGMVALVARRRGCLLAKAIAELGGESGDVDAIVGDFYRRYEDVFVRAIRQSQRAGETGTDTNARRHARLLVAVLRGIESMGKGGVPEATLRSIADNALAF